MILTSDTFVTKAHLENTNGISAAPCFSSLTLLCHCEVNWKAFSFIKASVEVGSVMQLSYLLSSPGLQQTNLSSQSLSVLCAPRLILDQLTLCKGAESVPSQKAPGCEQTWPRASHLVLVNNTSWKACLQSPQQGQKASLNLSGWLSDVEQMCWNGGNYVTPFSSLSLSCDHDDYRALIRAMWLCGGRLALW